MFGDAHASSPALATANSGGTVTTASFTPPAGTLLVAHAWHDTALNNTTNTSVITDSRGLTWNIVATRNKADAASQNGHLQVSYAWVPGGADVALTVTTTVSANGVAGGGAAGLRVRVVEAVDGTTPIDVVGEGSNAGGVVSLAITTVTDLARGFLAVIDWNVAANMTAGTGQTADVATGIGTGPDSRIFLGVANALKTPAGALTMSTGSPASGNTNNYIAYALRPSAGGPALVTLTPAVVHVTAPAVSAVPGVVTVPLTPASVDLRAVSVAATPGVVTVALTPARVDLIAVTATATPGVVTVALTPAVVHLQAVALSGAGAGAVTLTPATVTVAAVVLPATPGVVTVALVAAVVRIVAVALAVPVEEEPGNVVALDVRHGTITATDRRVGIIHGV